MSEQHDQPNCSLDSYWEFGAELKGGQVGAERVSSDATVIFVNGFGGRAPKDWAKMLEAIAGDRDLSSWSIDSYSMATDEFRLPHFSRFSGISLLAADLKTYIESKYPEKKPIVLVGHSLGGVVIRQYIVDMLRIGANERLDGAVLFASPHAESELRNIKSILSWRDFHLKKLCAEFEVLNAINRDWLALHAAEKIRSVCIAGASDSIVSAVMASPYYPVDNIKVVADHGYFDIVEPDALEDVRYLVLKRFLSSISESAEGHGRACSVVVSGDPLFYRYKLESERFYIHRECDAAVQEVGKRANIWVHGVAGVGKTAALTRLASMSGWRFFHVLLDSHVEQEAIGLFTTIIEMIEECVLGVASDECSDVNQIKARIRRIIDVLEEGETLSILIEEIPLRSREEIERFLEIAYQLANFTETIIGSKRIVWLYSSILDPNPYVNRGNPKFWEKLQVLEFWPWETRYMLALAGMLDGELKTGLSQSELHRIVEVSKGSPRVVKQVFERYCNATAAQKSLESVFSTIEVDFG